jgi:photosystem II stability/assembly factor-like uncharacterized protein
MKKQLTILLLFLLVMPIHAQYWEQQTSGVTVELRDVYCITEDIVVVVGNDGTILRTTDGGENWIQKNSGTNLGLMKLQFVNENIGYVLCSNGSLLKTINGGEDWFSIPTDAAPTMFDYYGLSCINESTFYVLGGSAWFKKTTDGGNTFQTINGPPNQMLQNIQFLNAQIGYASSYDSLFKTIDSGNSWSLITSGNTMDAFFFLNENIGFIYKDGGGVYKTIDGGLNLSSISGEFYFTTTDAFSLNENVVWEVGSQQLLCFCPPFYGIVKYDKTNTEDYLQTANGNFDGENATPLNAIHFASETKGYVVGWNGMILKNTTGDMENLALNEFDKTTTVSIYPNPSSEKITVSFNERPSQFFTVVIADSLGKNIFSKSYQPDNTATINVASFSKGVYFLTITSQEKRVTQKVIIK